ncbi:uncharacterized protein DUF4169 [Hoeflea marina]|uniref:Uncharacterized protein DUF4169 n=1 Tax=Hoeflea marina TaxID=274592 RepID=A0A317PG37_9HYPH|nr:DUF4169 family protein [Hoeflea marina]PWV99161.1 uncharacterized protein DUF4169 [Hoeflea marina]
MAGEVINLRQARKRRDRSEKEAAAERNRFEHGRTKAERDLARARNDQAKRRLDGGRRDPAVDEPDPK